MNCKISSIGKKPHPRPLTRVCLSSLILVHLLLSLAVSAQEKTGVTAPSIVPLPVHMKIKTGAFAMDKDTRIMVAGEDQEATRIARLFADQLHFAGGPDLTITGTGMDTKQSFIIFTLNREKKGIPPEGYELKVTQKQIHLTAESGAGLFYGVQTLFQLLPPEICKTDSPAAGVKWTIPCVEIKDHPRFTYRGMHLDVSRHFFPKEFVKRYIDLIAMYKMNTFHWHLTDDNGWRIEIKKYPKLMETAAWRVDHEDLPWNGRPLQKPGEKANYGGYYTQDQIREIVKYAADRYITVIPEIEMPAHCVAVLAAYPQFSCTGGPFTVPPGSYWPNLDIYCAGNDSVFTFLQDVLAEVMTLFPSKYIHVGGDEADKTNWKTCPKCQARMKAEGLKDEKELQSYFIKRIEKFIVSNGRKMIGWDEILEGGLAPEATVMSWRGVEGGIAAARQGHDAIMTPGSHCYFDYYQADPQFEPKAIGGLTTLKKVYSYEPVPEELTPEEARHILGAQGNVWTEFIPTPSHVEYMATARMIALSEVVWSPGKTRDWKDFRRRLPGQFLRLDFMKVNYSKGSFRAEVNTVFDKKSHQLRVIIGSEQADVSIHYTINGDEVTTKSPLYSGPFELNRNGIIRTGLFVDGKLKEKTVEMPFLFHLAIGKQVKYLSPYSSRYPASGPATLNDGLRGSSDHRDGLWQGFL
ncbi:MAG: family 20 glycosylhydrolase, partial [Bacteroidota bacterium]